MSMVAAVSCRQDCTRRVGFASWSTRIKDAGIAIRHSRGRILFYTAGSGNGLEGRGGVWKHGLATRLKKKNIFHPSSQAPGPGPGPCEEGWKI